MKPKVVLPFYVRINLEVKAMKDYFRYPRALGKSDVAAEYTDCISPMSVLWPSRLWLQNTPTASLQSVYFVFLEVPVV